MSQLGSRRSRGGVLVAALGTLALTIAGCTSSGKSSGSPSSTNSSSTGGSSSSSSNAFAVLGTPHKATGTPIKIGFVNDGKGATTDSTGAWNAAQAAASYANDYLNGINGHPIVLDHCETNFTTSGGTQCGIQMAKDKVAALLQLPSADDKQIHDAVSGAATGAKTIPYITTSTGDQGITNSPTSYVMANGLAPLAIVLAVAKQDHLKKAGIVIIGYPASAIVGPITKPMFAKAGITQDFLLIAPTVDPTGRLQQSIRSGTGAYTITGDDSFEIGVIKSFHNLGFKGPIILSITPDKGLIDGLASVPNALKGVLYASATTTDPANKDVQIYTAALQKYQGGNTPGISPQAGWVEVLALQRALQGDTTATTPATIIAALNKMKPTALPLGGGIKFQCGTHIVKLIPATCTTQVLLATLNAQGVAQGYKVVDTKQYFP